MSKLIYGRTWSDPVHWAHRYSVDFDGIREKSARPKRPKLRKTPRSLEEVREFEKKHKAWIAETRRKNEEKRLQQDLVLFLVYTLNSIFHPEMTEEEHKHRLYSFRKAGKVKQ